MPAAVWWTLAIGAMLAMFAACVLVVAVGVRMLERILVRRRQRAAR